MRNCSSRSWPRVEIRAPSSPPSAGTLEWFETGPDIPEEIAAQTPSSSQPATNSRIAAPPLKIVRTGEGWRARAEVACGWRMNDRGVEAEKERRVVYLIPYPVTMLSQRCRGKGGLQGWEL